MIRSLVTRIVGVAVALYLRVERRGPPVPDGPVLVVANHLNALVDPLVLFRTAGRPTRPLAKAPLFRHPLVGPILKSLGGLPIFRPRDDPGQTHRNEETFAAAIAALRRGEAVQVYPEGQSHSEPSMTRIRTGAARIALQAEAATGWTLGLRIVPVGLVYQRKHLFRGAAVASVGEPLAIGGWRAAWERDDQAAVRDLTDEIADRLAAVTLNVPSELDRLLVETAEALYTRATTEWREARRRGRTSLARRLPSLQAFARGLAHLQAEHPDEYRSLRTKVLRYRRLQELLGSEGDAPVPTRYAPANVLRHVLRQGIVLAALTPIAAVAVVAWWLPFHLPRWVVRVVEPSLDTVSTYKLGVAFLAFPATLLVWMAAAGVGLGWIYAILVGVLAIVAGLGWIAWSERWRRAGEDLRVLLRAGPRRRSRHRLAALRTELVREFERIAKRLAEADAVG